MMHSAVHLNKYVVSIAPLSTTACPDCSQNITYTEKTDLLCMFSLFNFSSIFPGCQLTPFAPMCWRPPMPASVILCCWVGLRYLPFSVGYWRRLQLGHSNALLIRSATALCGAAGGGGVRLKECLVHLHRYDETTQQDGANQGSFQTEPVDTAGHGQCRHVWMSTANTHTEQDPDAGNSHSLTLTHRTGPIRAPSRPNQ